VVVSLGKYDGLLIWGNLSVRGVFAALTKEFIEWKTMVRFWKWIKLPFHSNNTFYTTDKNQTPFQHNKLSESKKVDL
jgi:hypothetical protein